MCLTSAESIWSPQDAALLDLSEGREHDPDVVLIAFLRHHTDEQLSVLHRWAIGRVEKTNETNVWGKKTWSRDQHLISTSSPDTHNSKFSFGSLWSFLSMTRALSFACNLCVPPSSPPGMILFTNSEAVIMMWWAFLVEIKWMHWAISFLFLSFTVHHKDRKLFSTNAPKWRGKWALGV